MDMNELEALYANKDDGQPLRSFVDRMITKAMQTHDEKNPLPKDLVERVEKLETGYKARVRQMELRHHAFVACTKAGISPDMLDGFVAKDEAAIDAKIKQLTGGLKVSAERQVNERLVSGFKPGASHTENDDAPRKISYADFSKMNVQDQVDALQSGLVEMSGSL